MCYFAVHAVGLSLPACLASLVSDGVEFRIDSRSSPFVLAEPVKIIWVDDSVFALGQGYSPEPVTVANPPI